MELQDFVLKDSTKSEELRKVLSGLILDRPTLERVREVFRKELELGLKYGLEKVRVGHSSSSSSNSRSRVVVSDNKS